MTPAEDPEDPFNWSWLFSEDVWYGVCPVCGGVESVKDCDDEETLETVLVLTESRHLCGPELPDPGRYEEHYGIDDLKRRMGFPEDLI